MHNQITYFPYLTLKNIDEIDLPELNVKVWNFDRKAQDYIPDETMRAHVASILATNTRGGRPIKDIGVLSIGATDFRPFSQNEYNLANEIRLILFMSFSAVGNIVERGTNNGWRMATSENFRLILQNFELGNERMGEQSGEIVRMSAMGYKISEQQFRAPAHVLHPTLFRLDGDVLKSLQDLKKKRPRIYERILRSADMLYSAYYNDPTVDYNSRILLLTSCLEILLRLPIKDQRQELKQDIAVIMNSPADKLHTYYSERFDGKKEMEVGTKKEKWADRAYVLRNHIIHGDKIAPSEYMFDGKQSHVEIGMLFFIFLLRKQLDRSLRTRKFTYDEIEWTKYSEPGFEKEENPEEYRHEGFVYDKNEISRILARYRP